MKKTIYCCVFLCLLIHNSIAQSAGRSTVQQAESEIKEYGKKQSKERMQNQADRMSKYIGLYKSAKEMYAGLSALNKGECLPDFSVNPQAMVPSFCADDSTGKCGTCYAAAYDKLNNARTRLGRLKCMGLTMKNFVSKCVSFGDNVSSIHAVQGLAWQKERKGIMDAYSKFKDAYDAKYKELMDVLNNAMMMIDACEAKNGQADWYQRFGFVYVEFMAEKYKRTE